jgi:hypothetical protein
MVQMVLWIYQHRLATQRSTLRVPEKPKSILISDFDNLLYELHYLMKKSIIYSSLAFYIL